MISPMIICSERSSVLQLRSGFWCLTDNVVTGSVGLCKLKGPWHHYGGTFTHADQSKSQNLPQTWKLYGKESGPKIADMGSFGLGTIFSSTVWLSPHWHLASLLHLPAWLPSVSSPWTTQPLLRLQLPLLPFSHYISPCLTRRWQINARDH